MKAILIVDLPDTDYANRLISKPKIEYKVYEQALIDNITIYDANNEPIYVEIGIHGFEELKLVPNKDFVDEAESYQTEAEYKAYVSGWNDCIDKILEEE